MKPSALASLAGTVILTATAGFLVHPLVEPDSRPRLGDPVVLQPGSSGQKTETKGPRTGEQQIGAQPDEERRAGAELPGNLGENGDAEVGDDSDGIAEVFPEPEALGKRAPQQGPAGADSSAGQDGPAEVWDRPEEDDYDENETGDDNFDDDSSDQFDGADDDNNGADDDSDDDESGDREGGEDD